MGKVKIVSFIFLLVSVLDIAGIIFHIPYLIFIFKPFILLSLLLLYHVSVSEKNNWYVRALLFSFLGDAFLVYEGSFFFNLGLLSFLIAHLLFIKIVVSDIPKSDIKVKAISFIPFIITFSVLLYTLKDVLNEMLLPVTVYGVVISLFGAISLLNYITSKTTKSLFMLLGALFFITSDSILAINKFYVSKEIFKSVIMITYIIAQYLIYRSMVQKTTV
ncbi:lysoplasmalogenase [Lutibacter sp.]